MRTCTDPRQGQLTTTPTKTNYRTTLVTKLVSASSSKHFFVSFVNFVFQRSWYLLPPKSGGASVAPFQKDCSLAQRSREASARPAAA